MAIACFSDRIIELALERTKHTKSNFLIVSALNNFTFVFLNSLRLYRIDSAEYQPFLGV